MMKPNVKVNSIFLLAVAAILMPLLSGCADEEEDEVEPRTVPWTIDEYTDTVIDHTTSLTLKTNLPTSAKGQLIIQHREWEIDGINSVSCIENDTSNIHTTSCNIEVMDEDGTLTFIYNDTIFQENVAKDEHTSSDIDAVGFRFEGFKFRDVSCRNKLSEVVRTSVLDKTEKKGIDTYNYYTREINYQQKVTCNSGDDITLAEALGETRLVRTAHGSMENLTTLKRLSVSVNANSVSDVYIRYMDRDYYGFVSYNTPDVVTVDGRTTYTFDGLVTFFSTDRTVQVPYEWPFYDIIVKPVNGMSLDDTDLAIQYNHSDFGLEKSANGELFLADNESFLAMVINPNHYDYSAGADTPNKIISSSKPPVIDNATRVSFSVSVEPRVENTNLRPPGSSSGSVKVPSSGAGSQPNDTFTLTFNNNVLLTSASDLRKQEYPSGLYGYPNQIDEAEENPYLEIDYHGTEPLGTVKERSFGALPMRLNFLIWNNGDLGYPHTSSSFDLINNTSIPSAASSITMQRSWAMDSSDHFLVPPLGSVISRADLNETLTSKLGQELNNTARDRGSIGSTGVINFNLNSYGKKRIYVNKINADKVFSYTFSNVYAKADYTPQLVATGDATASMSCVDKMNYSQDFFSKKTYLNDFKEIRCRFDRFTGQGSIGVELMLSGETAVPTQRLFLVNVPDYSSVEFKSAIIDYSDSGLAYTITFNENLVDGLYESDFVVLTTGDVSAAVDRIEALGDGVYKIYLTNATGNGTVQLSFSSTFISRAPVGESGLVVEAVDNTLFPISSVGEPVTPSSILHTPNAMYVEEGAVSGKTYFEFLPAFAVSNVDESKFLFVSDNEVSGTIADVVANEDGSYQITVNRLVGTGSFQLQVLTETMVSEAGESLGDNFYSDPVDVITQPHVTRAVVVTLH